MFMPPTLERKRVFHFFFDVKNPFFWWFIMKKISTFFLIFVTIFLITACQKKVLVLATTTSLENSGLLAYLLPYFERETGFNVHVVAMGTGAVLSLAEKGGADVIIVHDYAREMAFMDAGFGEKRAPLMYNDFVFVGPAPIETGDLNTFLDALINGHGFYSRGDNSGTHAKERFLWEYFGLDVLDFGVRYQEVGQGMESTLMMASHKRVYTLSDRSTYLAMKEHLDLTIVFEGHALLNNPYAIIKVDAVFHGRDDAVANQFYDWILSTQAKQLITQFKINNEQLFFVYD